MVGKPANIIYEIARLARLYVTYTNFCLSVVSIPKSAILSTRNCSLSELIPQGSYGTEAQLGLTLGLYGEL